MTAKASSAASGWDRLFCTTGKPIRCRWTTCPACVSGPARNLLPGGRNFCAPAWTSRGEPADTFIKLPGMTKGIIFVNGRALSRYWAVGPQKSAYLPAPFLRTGSNEIIILELDGRTADTVLFDDQMDLG